MALKFLNKKGWHTGSLHNIERVWKAEQKNNAEQAKLEELRKQIHEEREKAEFRQLQEQAGLVPRQERLDFLYESGLGVGKTSDGFKALETPASAAAAAAPASAEASSSKAAAPGALFEEKPQSANDAWRKLHTDPLLLIRQREQEALARIKNNPIQMSMIRKSVEAEKKSSKKDKGHREKKHKKKHYRKSKSEKNSDTENISESEHDRRKRNHPTSDTQKHSKRKHPSDSRYSSESEEDRKMSSRSSRSTKDRSRVSERDDDRMRRNSQQEHRSRVSERDEDRTKRDNRHHTSRVSERDESRTKSNDQQGYNRKKGVPKMTEEEREARLREMQTDAELHEEQRWKRIKQSADADAREAARASNHKGKNFLDDAQKSIYGAEKGGSSTIEDSVRRRAYYSQGGTDAHESNAFRR